MGLDMYAYAGLDRQREAYQDQDGDWDLETREWINAGPVSRPRELAYWRKHPNLHGWMNRVWQSRGNTGDFNGDELELTWQDIEDLEQAVRHQQLPQTEGFFFGQDRDAEYYQQDLKFCADAKAELFLGLKVFYNSSW
jgi:hypothetical protein